MNLFKPSFHSKLAFLISRDSCNIQYVFKYSLESRVTSLFQNCPAGAESTNMPELRVLCADLANTPYLSAEKQPSFVIFSSTLDYLQAS